MAWGLAVALVTLLPRDSGGPTLPFLCAPCGTAGSADGVLNTVLFAPLGFALGPFGTSPALATGIGFGISAAIEAAQTRLPGRYPTLADIVFNSLGALLGLLAFRAVSRDRLPGPPTWTAVGLAALVGTAVLARPAPPDGALFGQHTPQLGRFAVYRGSVVSARVGDVEVPSTRLSDPDPLRRALESGDPVEVAFRAGPTPPYWAPVFAVYSGDQEEAFFFAIRGDDVLVRSGSLAARLRFHAPGAVAEGAMDGVAPGAPVEARIVRSTGGWCVDIDARSACGLGIDPLDGWSYLLGGRDSSDAPEELASVLWLAGILGLVAGARTRSTRGAVVGTAVLLTTIAALPLVSSLAPAGPLEVGLGLGLAWVGSSLVSRIPGWRKPRQVR